MSAQVSRHHNEFNGGLPTVLLVDVEDSAPDIPPPSAIACRQGEVPDPWRGEGEGLQGGVGVPPPDDVFSRVLLKYMKVNLVQIGFKSILLIVHFCRWQNINLPQYTPGLSTRPTCWPNGEYFSPSWGPHHPAPSPPALPWLWQAEARARTTRRSPPPRWFHLI